MIRQYSRCSFLRPQRALNAVVRRLMTSSKKSLVSTVFDEDSAVATISMNRPPVNSLSLDLFQDLSNAIREVEANRNIQSLIVASSLPRTFSAGLDLIEMYEPDTARLKDFWTAFQQFYIDLYGSRLASIAAIDGHAPAAGCMIALSCDYRVMNNNPKLSIGLNETQFGIAAPPFLARQMMDTMGRRPAELAMSRGTLFSPQDALKLGLVDEVSDDVAARSKIVALEWARIPPFGRVATKKMVRHSAINHLLENRSEDLENFVEMVLDPGTQLALGSYFASLKGKGAK